MSALVSIVMALPTADERVADSLESLLHQTHSPLELVIAGSNEALQSLQQIVSESRFSERFEGRIHLLADDRTGAVSALLKQAVVKARGEFLSFIEPGDVYDMDRISALLEGVTAEGADVAFGLMDLRGPSNYTYYRYIWELEQFQKQLNFYPYKGLACLNGKHLMMIGNLLVRASILSPCGGIGEQNVYYQQDILLRSLFYKEPHFAASVLDWRHVGNSENDNWLAQEQLRDMHKIYEDFMFRVGTEIPANQKCMSPSHWQSFFSDYLDCMNLQEDYNNGMCNEHSYRYNQSKT